MPEIIIALLKIVSFSVGVLITVLTTTWVARAEPYSAGELQNLALGALIFWFIGLGLIRASFL